MRVWALGLAGVGCALLGGLGFAAGSAVLGGCGMVLLAGWITAVWFTVPRAGTLLLPASVAVAASAVFSGVAVLPVTAAVTLVLVGWELTNGLSTTAAYPATDRRSVLRRHLVRLFGLGSVALVLSAVSLRLHVHLGFRLGLALALASLVLLGLVLRLGARPARQEKKEEAEQ